MLDLEADTCPQRHVEKILSVALKHRCLSEEHSTLVHCGRTKVFLTQVMVSHLKSVFHYKQTSLFTFRIPSASYFFYLFFVAFCLFAHAVLLVV